MVFPVTHSVDHTIAGDTARVGFPADAGAYLSQMTMDSGPVYRIINIYPDLVPFSPELYSETISQEPVLADPPWKFDIIEPANNENDCTSDLAPGLIQPFGKSIITLNSNLGK